jgi:CRISPR-associated exonuclease Cas4
MESYITLSHLNDFIFCPRSIYYHQLYSIYDEQHYKQRAQIAGTTAHNSIDNKPKLRIRKLKRVLKDFGIVPKSTKPQPSFFAESYF